MDRLMERTLRTLVAWLLLCAAAAAYCPRADLSGDCRIDFRDVAVLAGYWLDPPESPGDINLDDEVDFRDLNLIRENWHLTGIPIVINEVLASNPDTTAKRSQSYYNTWRDPQGEFEDWIELHNFGDQPIDVGGMYLTDTPSTPTLWRIPTGNPAQTTIAPGGYLLIWADGDTADAGLHAPFELALSGDEVALYDSDGTTLIHHIFFDSQTPDVSYGCFPDGVDNWRFLVTPTPGAPNSSAYAGEVADTKFSHDRGFYTAPFELAITCETPDAVIYYTLDGKEPYDLSQRPPGGIRYTGPITISATTTLRAKAVLAGYKPSNIDTHTYIFLNDVIRQSPTGAPPGVGWPSSGVNGQVLDYGMDPDIVNSPQYSGQIIDALRAIPSISLVLKLNDLFNPDTGIYVNAYSDGRAWERPTSIELINPDGAPGFQIDGGIRIRGGYSRSSGNPKHAFRLFFRSDYGKSTLEFPLFGDEGADRFKKVDLRTSQNYSWAFDGSSQNTFIRDEWSRDTELEMGQPTTRSRYYHLYINGQYWGLYETQERAEANWAETYLGGNSDDYDVLKSKTGEIGMQPTDGNMEMFARMHSIAVQGFYNNTNYWKLQGLNPDGTPNPAYEKHLDVDNVIDEMIIEYYTGDRDGPGSLYTNGCNNTVAVANRREPAGWIWPQHDSEHSLGTGETDMVNRTYSNEDSLSRCNVAWLHRKMTDDIEYRTRFGDRVQKHLFNGGLLTVEKGLARVDKRAAQIDLAIIAESARWGNSKVSTPYTRQHWLTAVASVRSWISGRRDVLIQQFRGRNWFPSIDGPTLGHFGGRVPVGFTLTLSAPTGDIWYTTDGSDPRLIGGTLNPVAVKYTGGGGFNTVLAPENATKRAFVPTQAISDAWRGGASFDDSAWRLCTGSPGGIGFERGTGYDPYISLDVEADMYGRNATCYVRIPFNVTAEQRPAMSALTLRVRYDDAYVAYLNGTEVARKNFTGTPVWNSRATSSHSDSAAVVFEDVDITAHMSRLSVGANILAIHAMNSTTTNLDFLISAQLEATIPASGSPLTFTETTQVKARARSGSTWSAMSEAVYAVGPVAENLRITELMYHPLDTGDPNDPITEFVELTNIGSESINLNFVKFTRGISFTFPRLTLAPNQYTVVVADIPAFTAKYGQGIPIAGQYTGRLDNSGEGITLVDAAGAVIHNFRYKDGWYDMTDGDGFSLTVRDPRMADPNLYSDKQSWRPSALVNGSPGWDDTGYLPDPGSVVINEVLAHSHAEAADWIELHNTTDAPIEIGGWFLSDSDANETSRMKYRIAEGTVIPAGGYIVFYQNLHFGNPSDPGAIVPFALSENGEEVVLTSGQDGVLTGYRDYEDFGPSATGIAFGRHRKSDGSFNFVAMSVNTPGAANAYPLVGPIVINEIMYNPASGNQNAEYIELLNITSSPVTLYDVLTSSPWKFTDAIEFTFPKSPPLTVPAGGFVLVVTNRAAFEAEFGAAPAGVPVFEYASGNLSNSGEKLELSMPGDVDKYGVRQYIRIDRVNYSDGSHPAGEDPWPTEADGGGKSLNKVGPTLYGNDVVNWTVAVPSPGRHNP